MSFQRSPKIVAAIQFSPGSLQIEENLCAAQALAFEAASKGARIITFPELCLCEDDITDRRMASEYSQCIDGYQTEMFLPICEKFNCHVVFGYVELHDNKLYNSAVIVGPSGAVGNTRKHNLHGTDYFWADQCDDLMPTVLTTEGRLGVLLSRDAKNCYRKSYKHYNEDNRFYQKNCVDIIALLTCCDDTTHPSSEWMELAESVATNVIVANTIGEKAGVRVGGGSCVISRDLNVWTHGARFIGSTIVGGVLGE